MTDNYPFTGTGNLYRFCQGLISIGIQNKVIILYDNDTAAREKYEMTKNLDIPSNMVVAQLPELEEFEDFVTIGPNGTSRENINGRAVAIEHFLDLNYRSNTEPTIRWTSYNEKLDNYQGELLNKELYVRNFKKIRNKSDNYDFSKLHYLLDFLYKQCIQVKSSYNPIW